jgi:ATP-dependent Clp protease ATP-binding subunit ClpC
MFERFTDRARRVVVLAQEEARMLNHNYIGTEHVLLGLIHEGEGVAAQVLVRLGADLNRVRAEVIKLVNAGRGEAERAGPRPSPPIREVLFREVQSALRSIEERLTAIERHLGMQGPAAAPDDPAAPASGDTQAAAPDDPAAAASDD